MWVEVCRVEILHLGRDCVLFPGSQGQILFFSPGLLDSSAACFAELSSLSARTLPHPTPFLSPSSPHFFPFPLPFPPPPLLPPPIHSVPLSTLFFRLLSSGLRFPPSLPSYFLSLPPLSPLSFSLFPSPAAPSAVLSHSTLSNLFSLPTTDVREGEMETPAEFPTPIPPSRKGAASECPGMHQPSSAITDVSMSQH